MNIKASIPASVRLTAAVADCVVVEVEEEEATSPADSAEGRVRGRSSSPFRLKCFGARTGGAVAVDMASSVGE